MFTVTSKADYDSESKQYTIETTFSDYTAKRTYTFDNIEDMLYSMSKHGFAQIQVSAMDSFYKDGCKVLKYKKD